MRTRDLLLAGACLLGACSSRPPQKPAPAVRIEVVGSGKAMGSADTYSAVAQAKATVPLAFRGPGYVTELMQVKSSDGRTRAVGEGDRVRKGEVIARLRDAEYRDKVGQATGQVAAARAAAEKARLDFERAQRLFATQSITRPEMETATAQRDGTRAQLAAAEAASGRGAGGAPGHRADRPGGRRRDEEERRAGCVHRPGIAGLRRRRRQQRQGRARPARHRPSRGPAGTGRGRHHAMPSRARASRPR